MKPSIEKSARRLSLIHEFLKALSFTVAAPKTFSTCGHPRLEVSQPFCVGIDLAVKCAPPRVGKNSFHALLESRVSLPRYPPTALDYKRQLKAHNERQFFLELVKEISNELDLRALSYKILIFVCLMVDADRGSLFLVEGGGGGGKKSLVSKVFDVHAGTPWLPCSSTANANEVQVPWGKGIIGYVAQHGEIVNIPDAYQDRRFNDEIDKLTGYKTKSLLCMPIRNSDGEIIGVAQAINKTTGGAPFTDDDEKVRLFSAFSPSLGCMSKVIDVYSFGHVCRNYRVSYKESHFLLFLIKYFLLVMLK
nr:dual 3',5'-cyclic-AMP and -GMP phosphodiesterase 11A-like [Pogona vitticeps]